MCLMFTFLFHCLLFRIEIMFFYKVNVPFELTLLLPTNDDYCL